MGTADSLNATAAQQNTTPIANQTLSKSQLGDSDNTTAGSEDIVHVVWSDSTPTTPEIFHRRAGGLFDPTARITLSNIPGVTQVLGEWPAIAISGPEVYVVWHDTTGEGTPFDIWLRKSEDGGATFGSPINVSNDPGDSIRPKIAVAGQFVYIVWEDNGSILFAKSTDRGATFSSSMILSNTIFGNNGSPTIAAPRARHVFISWHNLQTEDIWFIKSADFGATFGSPINVSNDDVFSFSPKIAVDVSNVYLVWITGPIPPQEIRFSRSTDGGVTFDASQLIGNGTWPAIAATANDNTAYVTWVDNGDLRFRRSTDGGATFEFPRRVINNPGTAFHPAIAASDSLPGNVYIVWVDQAPTNPNNEIFFVRSRDSGSHFEPFSTNLSLNAGSSDRPAIAILDLR